MEKDYALDENIGYLLSRKIPRLPQDLLKTEIPLYNIKLFRYNIRPTKVYALNIPIFWHEGAKSLTVFIGILYASFKGI